MYNFKTVFACTDLQYDVECSFTLASMARFDLFYTNVSSVNMKQSLMSNSSCNKTVLPHLI